MSTKIERELIMMARCEVILAAVKDNPGGRVSDYYGKGPYDRREVQAALIRLWRQGFLSRHLNKKHGNFRYFQWYPTEKAR